MVLYMKKMTNKEMFGMVKAMVLASGAVEVDIQAAVEFIDKQIEQLDKKAANKKLTKAQLENEAIKTSLEAVLAEQGMLSISDIQKLEGFEGYSNQKLSALLNQMVKAEIITKAFGTDRKTVFGFENPKTKMAEQNSKTESAPSDEGELVGDIDRAHELALLWQAVLDGDITHEDYAELTA